MQGLFRRLSCGGTPLIATLLILGGCAQVRAVPAPSDTSPISATLAVDWKTVVGTTTPATFSANDEMCTNPTQGSGNGAYAKNLSDIGIKFYRLHCGSLTDDWSNPSTHQWNVNAITAEYNAPYLRDATIIQNIPAPPSWLRNDDGTVSDAAGYAAYCAQLVNIINKQLKKHVVYWEPMNEWEDRYKGNWARACEVYNQCAEAMKRQDPGIKIGPALEWPDQGGIIQPLLRQCAGNVDFIAYHSYYSSGPADSNDTLMAKASAMDHDVTNTRDSIKKLRTGPRPPDPARRIQLGRELERCGDSSVYEHRGSLLCDHHQARCLCRRVCLRDLERQGRHLRHHRHERPPAGPGLPVPVGQPSPDRLARQSHVQQSDGGSDGGAAERNTGHHGD